MGVEQSQRFSGLCSKLGDPFSCVLRVASSDFGMFKFAAACADAAIESGSFGTQAATDAHAHARAVACKLITRAVLWWQNVHMVCSRSVE